jgi:hypothetical protein
MEEEREGGTPIRAHAHIHMRGTEKREKGDAHAQHREKL